MEGDDEGCVDGFEVGWEVGKDEGTHDGTFDGHDDGERRGRQAVSLSIVRAKISKIRRFRIFGPFFSKSLHYSYHDSLFQRQCHAVIKPHRP